MLGFFPTMTRLILSLENLNMTFFDESATNEINERPSDEAEQKLPAKVRH
jgi:hypothetical protein